jgi:hypothetical protein
MQTYTHADELYHKINDKKLLSLKPVVRSRRSYKQSCQCEFMGDLNFLHFLASVKPTLIEKHHHLEIILARLFACEQVWNRLINLNEQINRHLTRRAIANVCDSSVAKL